MVLPNLPSELIDQERRRNKSDGDEAQYGVTPAQAEGGVHARTGEREESAEQGTGDCEGGDARGSEGGEGVNGISLDGDEDAHHAETT